MSSVFSSAYTPTSKAVLSSSLRYKQESMPEVRHFVWTLESTLITGDYSKFRHFPDSGHSGN